jgi:UDP-glucose 4-epimerase
MRGCFLLKKILITGAESYIGQSFEKWLGRWPDRYVVDTVDMKDESWKEKKFSGYDAVFHVAGIAHVDTKTATSETKELYYKVNRDLAIQAAVKAKQEAVKQFIFMSSIIVYGDSSCVGGKKIITGNTIPNPSNFYGDSKLQAERGILPLQSENFNVVVLRPPMIYGQGSKGNYPKLAKLARISPLFPDVYNQRSMLHINNLCEFLRLMIDNNERGIFYPQNDEYACTSDMVRTIAKIHGKHMKLTKLFNPFLRLLPQDIIYKMFGSVVYDKELSSYRENYNLHNFKETLQLSEAMGYQGEDNHIL